MVKFLLLYEYKSNYFDFLDMGLYSMLKLVSILEVFNNPDTRLHSSYVYKGLAFFGKNFIHQINLFSNKCSTYNYKFLIGVYSPSLILFSIIMDQ